MAIRKIREIGDEVLTKVCKEVTKMTPRTTELIDDMFETMYDAMGVRRETGKQAKLLNEFIDLFARLEQPLSAGDITLVKKAADKAEALVLALLAHGVGDGRPVKAVQLRGDRAHIAVRGRAAAQHGGQQRAGGDGALFQRRDELRAQHAGLEFCGGDVGQKNALRQFLSQGLHKSGSFSILY